MWKPGWESRRLYKGRNWKHLTFYYKDPTIYYYKNRTTPYQYERISFAAMGKALVNSHEHQIFFLQNIADSVQVFSRKRRGQNQQVQYTLYVANSIELLLALNDQIWRNSEEIPQYDANSILSAPLRILRSNSSTFLICSRTRFIWLNPHSKTTLSFSFRCIQRYIEDEEEEKDTSSWNSYESSKALSCDLMFRRAAWIRKRHSESPAILPTVLHDFDNIWPT
jgi:hypothetical protein